MNTSYGSVVWFHWHTVSPHTRSGAVPASLIGHSVCVTKVTSDHTDYGATTQDGNRSLSQDRADPWGGAGKCVCVCVWVCVCVRECVCVCLSFVMERNVMMVRENNQVLCVCICLPVFCYGKRNGDGDSELTSLMFVFDHLWFVLKFCLQMWQRHF